MQSVAVIDYGMGNIHSVAKALEHAGRARVVVTHDHQQLRQADRLVLPGVGAIRDCMAELARLGLDHLILELAATKPLLGVCVGMQAMMDRSAENGGIATLGLFQGEVVRFADPLRATDGTPLKVPHMGWNRVHQSRPHPLWHAIADESRFYFVHSYHVVAANPHDIAATSHHGSPFTAALARDNLFATQFHPEKSGRAGLQLYANFLDWDGTL
jgi:imidazole glycerol-phosphate synthase subunit HisH